MWHVSVSLVFAADSDEEAAMIAHRVADLIEREMPEVGVTLGDDYEDIGEDT